MSNKSKYPHSVGDRVHRFLYNSKAREPHVQILLMQIANALPETVVFGGMLRDFGLSSACEFNSDIDLVTMADKNEILSLIRPFSPTLNKFGGFRFFAGKQMFDIWAFHDTWAFRENLVCGDSFFNLCKTTFFNVDAACQQLGTREVISDDSFFPSITNRVLDINLESNPTPKKIAERTIRLAIKYEMEISPKLQQFVLTNVEKRLWNFGPTKSFLKLLVVHMNKHGEQVPFKFEPQYCLF